jgi:hypothetical protein
MFVDALLLLSDAQAFSATAVSTNTIDLGNVTPKRDLATGEPMALVCQNDVAADFTTGDETYTLEVITSATSNLASPTVLASSLFTAAERAIGSIKILPIPPVVAQQFLGARLTLAGTTPSVTVTMFIQPLAMASLAKPQSYAKGYTIS